MDLRAVSPSLKAAVHSKDSDTNTMVDVVFSRKTKVMWKTNVTLVSREVLLQISVH